MQHRKLTAQRELEQAGAPGPHHHRNPHGSDFALIPQRLADLPGGEGLVMAWLIAARRSDREALGYSFGDLGRCIGCDSRTLAAHVASLRAKGAPIHPTELRATSEAFTKPGERHARVMVKSLMAQPNAAEYRAHVVERLFTDPTGKLRVSRSFMADALGRSSRAVRTAIAGCRNRGILCAATSYVRSAKTFRSTRQKASALRAKAFPLSEKGVRKGTEKRGDTVPAKAEPRVKDQSNGATGLTLAASKAWVQEELRREAIGRANA